jgi:hypothetical protein
MIQVRINVYDNGFESIIYEIKILEIVS